MGRANHRGRVHGVQSAATAAGEATPTEATPAYVRHTPAAEATPAEATPAYFRHPSVAAGDARFSVCDASRSRAMGCVWLGMVWYSVVWYGLVWYGLVWYDVYGMALYGMLVKISMAGMVWLVGCGMAGYGMVGSRICRSRADNVLMCGRLLSVVPGTGLSCG